MEIYTSIEEARILVKQRWLDKELQQKILERIGEEFSPLFKEGPIGIMGRNIGTPDGEFYRFLKLNKMIGTHPVILEYTEDKFVAKNISKYSIANLPCRTGNPHDSFNGVKHVKIINFKNTEGKKLSSLKTLWNESLVDFHHRMLFSSFPEMKDRILDMSEWFKKNKSPINYYKLVFSIAISQAVYFEDFFSFDEESDFVKNIVIPAFIEVKDKFNITPILVRISETDDEYRNQSNEMFYSQEILNLIEQKLKN
jgi:hypothetical protein